MSSSNLTLAHFRQPVAVCSEFADLEAVLEIFQSGEGDRLVVINQRQSPLGVIRASRLISSLLEEARGEKKAIAHWLEPIPTLPAQMRVGQFMSYLEAAGFKDHHHSSFALLDSEEKFLGLLDIWSLLKSAVLSTANRDFQEGLLQSLCHLLEGLPLPLMLQTATGEIISRNLSWLNCIGPLNPSLENNQVAVSSGVTPSKEEGIPMVGEIQPYCRKENSFLPTRSSLKPLQLPDLSRGMAIATLLRGKVGPDLAEESPAGALRGIGGGQQQEKSEQVWQLVKLPLNFPLSEPISLVMATDISKQQKLFKELAAKNADLVQLNRLKDEFLACITHELKSPLTAVVGLSSLLKDRKLGELNLRQARYAKQIYQSGRQLMTLVNDILDLTRLETGQLKLNPTPVKIKEICEAAYKEAESRTLKKQEEKTSSPSLQFNLKIESGLETIVADELRLRQMLIHLLDNALKFTACSEQSRTASGGEIGMRVNRWFSWIAFTVWDTGIGIPEESQHLIFQKFQQLENPLTRKFEGSGLGLVLTQRLARAHGGDVSFISKVGQGSQFTILLPPSPDAKSQSEKHTKTQSSTCSAVGQAHWPGLAQREVPVSRTADKLILIVEAVPQYIENLTAYLTSRGNRVVIARTGTEAVEKARQLQPYLILLNPLLPLLSGWDVLTLLKADEKTKNIDVLIMATEAEKQQGLENGADGFLNIPVQKEALNHLLNGFEQNSSLYSARNLTILHLYAPVGFALNAEFALAFSDYASNFNHRILEVGCLEQAEILVRVWQPDVILLDGKGLADPLTYLQSLSKYEGLASLPLVTLNTSITEAANQIKNLSVFPCLFPVNEHNLQDLLAVINIATEVISVDSSSGALPAPK